MTKFLMNFKHFLESNSVQNSLENSQEIIRNFQSFFIEIISKRNVFNEIKSEQVLLFLKDSSLLGALKLLNLSATKQPKLFNFYNFSNLILVELLNLLMDDKFNQLKKITQEIITKLYLFEANFLLQEILKGLKNQQIYLKNITKYLDLLIGIVNYFVETETNYLLTKYSKEIVDIYLVLIEINDLQVFKV